MTVAVAAGMTSFKDVPFGGKSLIRSSIEAGSLQIVALGSDNACGGGQSSSLGSCLVERLLLDYGKRCKLRHGLQNDRTGACVHALLEHSDGATGFRNEAQHDDSGLGYPLLERLLLDDFREGSANGRGSRVSQVVSS